MFCVFALASVAPAVLAQTDAAQLQIRALNAVERYLQTARSVGQVSDADRRDLARAEEEAEASARAFLAAGNRGAAAFSLVQQARSRFLLGRAEPALEAYRAAAELARAAPDIASLARALRGMIDLHTTALRQYAEASALLPEMMRVSASAADRMLYVDALLAKATLEQEQKQLVPAIHSLGEAVLLVQQGGDGLRQYYAHQQRASVLFDIAHECAALPDAPYATCRAMLERSIDDLVRARDAASRLGLHTFVWVAESQRSNSVLRLATLDYDGRRAGLQPCDPIPLMTPMISAAADQQRSIILERQDLERRLKLPDRSTENAAMLNQVNDMRARAREVDRFADQHNATLSACRLSWTDPDITYINPVQPRHVLPMDIMPPADRSLTDDLNGLSYWIATHPNQTVRDRYREVRALAAADRAAALDAYEALLTELDTDRLQLLDDQARVLFLRDRAGIFDKAGLQLLHDGREAEAFSMLERGRNRAFADLLATAADADTIGRTLLATVSRLRAELSSRQSSDVRTIAPDSQPPFDPKRAQENRQLQAQLDAAIEDLQQRAPHLRMLQDARLASLEQTKVLVKRDGFDLLYFVVRDKGIVIWHLGPEGSQVEAIVLSRHLLRAKLQRLFDSVRGGGAVDEGIARQLYLFLIEPVRERLTGNRPIVIIPHSDLRQLPFQLLLDPGTNRYFGEDRALSYAPSATLLLEKPKVDALHHARLLTVTDPNVADASTVAEALQALHPPQLVLSRPSKDQLIDQLRGREALHFFLHADFDQKDPMLSAITLDDRLNRSVEQRRLTAVEMLALPLGGTRLVTMIACNAGGTALTESGETLGMVRALLSAGAHSAVLPAWKVFAPSAALWSREFYRHLETQPAAEAARLALLAVKNDLRFRSPEHWAPYLYFGR